MLEDELMEDHSEVIIENHEVEIVTKEGIETIGIPINNFYKNLFKDLPIYRNDNNNLWDYSINKEIAIVIPLFLGYNEVALHSYTKCAVYSTLSFLKNSDIKDTGVGLYLGIEREIKDIVDPYLDLAGVPVKNRLYFDRPKNDLSDVAWDQGCLSLKVAPIFHSSLQDVDKVYIIDADCYVLDSFGQKNVTKKMPLTSYLSTFDTEENDFATITYQHEPAITYESLLPTKERESHYNVLFERGSDEFIEKIAHSLSISVKEVQELISADKQHIRFTLGVTGISSSTIKNRSFSDYFNKSCGLYNDEVLFELWVEKEKSRVHSLNDHLPIFLDIEQTIGRVKNLYHISYHLEQEPKYKVWWHEQIENLRSWRTSG